MVVGLGSVSVTPREGRIRMDGKEREAHKFDAPVVVLIFVPAGTDRYTESHSVYDAYLVRDGVELDGSRRVLCVNLSG